MDKTKIQDRRFGKIAMSKGFVTKDDMERALKVQKRAHHKIKVYVPIGKILQQMGLLTDEQLDSILTAQENMAQTPLEEKKTEDDLSLHIDEDLESDAEKFSITVSEDALLASISISEENREGTSLDDIRTLLEKEGIVFGIVSDAFIEKFLQSPLLPDEPFQMAHGKAPRKGKPDEIRYYFDTDPLRVGTMNEDGTMDWKDHGEIPYVNTGDLIAEKIPGEEGSPGMDIYGRLIPPPLPQKIKLSPGEGAKTSEDGLKVFSTLNGTPKIMPDGRLCVLPTIKIDGDVGVETGHVEFDGHIDVSGAVKKGYKVKGKSLQAREINHAEIEIDEDIVVFRGIYGSDIKGGGDLKASHIHHSSIDVLGDVIVEKEIFESQIETNGKCVIGGGTVITSEISAKKGIIAHDIGTLAAKPSSLTVGIDHKLQRELSNIKKKIAEETQKKTELEDLIPPLRERSDKLNTELGEIAVEQDKYMVQQREIEERLKDPHSQLDDDTKEKQAKVIHALMLKRNEIDDKVAELLNEDEEIDQKISGLEKEINGLKSKIESLKDEIDIMIESSKLDKGIPVIKVFGEIFPKTSITAPHCNGTIQKTIQRAYITETDKSGPNGPSRWHITVSKV
jgi:uncharacterized protein (DUF342 family)